MVYSIAMLVYQTVVFVLHFFPNIFDIELMSGVSFHTYRLTRIFWGLRFYKIKGGSEIDEQQMMGNDSAGSGFK